MYKRQVWALARAEIASIIKEFEGAKARAEIASIIKEFDREYMAWCAKPNPDQEPHMAVNGKHDEAGAKSLLRSQVGLEIAS